jgi:methionine salvage enolase-phosphatase E1
MKSLKEFIAENLENSTVTTVQENTEKQVDENNNQETVQEDNKPNED